MIEERELGRTRKIWTDSRKKEQTLEWLLLLLLLMMMVMNIKGFVTRQYLECADKNS